MRAFVWLLWFTAQRVGELLGARPKQARTSSRGSAAGPPGRTGARAAWAPRASHATPSLGLHTNLTTYDGFLHDFWRFSLKISRFFRDFSRCTPVFDAILVAARLYFTRCASERERSERERCASSRVRLAISRFCRDFCAILSRFSLALAHRVKYRRAATKNC